MIERHVSPRERMAAHTEWAALLHEAESMRSLHVESFFHTFQALYGDKRLPPRLEVQSKYEELLLPRRQRDDFLKKAYAMPDDLLLDSEYRGPRLSFVLEVPQDNIIYLEKKKAERTVDTYAVRFYKTGDVECIQGTRRIDCDTQKRIQKTRGIVATVYSAQLNRETLLKSLHELFPYKRERRKYTW